MEEISVLSCRGCLADVTTGNLFTFACDKTKKLFTDCTSIPIQSDELPKQICSECYAACQQWSDFRERCREVNEQLLASLPEQVWISEAIVKEEVKDEDVIYEEVIYEESSQLPLETQTVELVLNRDPIQDKEPMPQKEPMPILAPMPEQDPMQHEESEDDWPLDVPQGSWLEMADFEGFCITTLEELNSIERLMKADRMYKKAVNDWITKKYREKGNLREIIADKVMDRFTTSKKHLSVLGRTRTLASKSLFFKEVEDVCGDSKVFQGLFNQMRSRLHTNKSQRKKNGRNETSEDECSPILTIFDRLRTPVKDCSTKLDQSCTSSVQPFAERVPDQHQTLQVQLPNIRVVHTAPHVMVTKRRYYASHCDETPEFPVTSVEEVELMGEMITVDKAFKKAVIKMVKKADKKKKLSKLISDAAMDKYTLSKKHVSIKGNKRKLAEESPLFQIIEEVVGTSKLKLLFFQMRSRMNSKASLAKKKAAEERCVVEM